jgi:DNA-binding transcriptional ArsR family regulator
MKSKDAVIGLAALAQESRLALFRLLVKRGPEGYTPTALGEKLGMPAPTLSFHLKELQRAGLIEGL